MMPCREQGSPLPDVKVTELRRGASELRVALSPTSEPVKALSWDRLGSKAAERSQSSQSWLPAAQTRAWRRPVAVIAATAALIGYLVNGAINCRSELTRQYADALAE